MEDQVSRLNPGDPYGLLRCTTASDGTSAPQTTHDEGRTSQRTGGKCRQVDIIPKQDAKTNVPKQ